MTKYILHGGNTREISPDNDSFFREITLGSKNKTLVLLNYFAREDNEVEGFAEQDKQRFLQNSGGKDLEFEIAHPKQLTEQLSHSDVMYMRGGETNWLKEKLLETPNLAKLFEGKTIAGSSAGVYVLSKYYCRNDTDKLCDGLGIINLKAYCHYKPEDEEIINKLSAYREKLPLLVLPNHKWVVFYQ